MLSDEFVDMWRNVEPAKKYDKATYEDLPQGKYIVKIEDYRFDEQTTNDGKTLQPCMHYILTVTQGQYTGRKVFKNDYFNSEKSVQFIKADIQTLGCNIPRDPYEIPTALNSALGKTVEIEIKHKPNQNGGKFVNIYFVRRVDVMTPNGAASQSFAGEMVSEIPF